MWFSGGFLAGGAFVGVLLVSCGGVLVGFGGFLAGFGALLVGFIVFLVDSLVGFWWLCLLDILSAKRSFKSSPNQSSKRRRRP